LHPHSTRSFSTRSRHSLPNNALPHPTMSSLTQQCPPSLNNAIPHHNAATPIQHCHLERSSFFATRRSYGVERSLQAAHRNQPSGNSRDQAIREMLEAPREAKDCRDPSTPHIRSRATGCAPLRMTRLGRGEDMLTASRSYAPRPCSKSYPQHGKYFPEDNPRISADAPCTTCAHAR
jgi:hypothetical protein